MRCAAIVTELKLLESEHLTTTVGQLVRSRAAERPETDDDVVDRLGHSGESSRDSSQRRMSRLSSSIGANHPCSYDRDDIPRCTDSQIAQSCRLTRSQRSAASAGLKVSFSTSSGANSRSQSIRVRSWAIGHSVNAATCSAAIDSIKLG